MRNMKFGILVVLAVLALVSVASAGLPSQVTATIYTPGPSSYWNVNVGSTVGGSDILTSPDYAGWCGSSTNGLSAGTHTFKVYSSLQALPPGLPTMDWKKVNYVINHQDGANAATLQAVYWYYDSGYYAWNPAAPLGPVDPVKKAALIAAADAAILANPTYEPTFGEDYAVILWEVNPQTGAMSTSQPVFIEVPIPSIPSPEFPTVALPIAMLIGVVGAVQFIRARKE